MPKFWNFELAGLVIKTGKVQRTCNQAEFLGHATAGHRNVLRIDQVELPPGFVCSAKVTKSVKKVVIFKTKVELFFLQKFTFLQQIQEKCTREP